MSRTFSNVLLNSAVYSCQVSLLTLIFVVVLVNFVAAADVSVVVVNIT